MHQRRYTIAYFFIFNKNKINYSSAASSASLDNYLAKYGMEKNIYVTFLVSVSLPASLILHTVTDRKNS